LQNGLSMQSLLEQLDLSQNIDKAKRRRDTMIDLFLQLFRGGRRSGPYRPDQQVLDYFGTLAERDLDRSKSKDGIAIYSATTPTVSGFSP
jgi:hypothetical protein